MRYATCVFTALLSAALLAQSAKEYKSREEYDLHAQTLKEFTARNHRAALESLAAWEKRFPGSAFAADRALLYVQVHAANADPAKALDAAAPLLAAADAAFANPDDRLRLLYLAATLVHKVPDPSPAQIDAARTAAAQLAAYDRKPAATSDADWVKARQDLQSTARFALVHLALLPAAQAMKKQDCAAAERAASAAVTSHPESVQAVWQLALAHLCLSRTQPEHAPAAIYQFARAASLDPVKGMVEPSWQQSTVLPYLEKIFTQYHGADPEALRQLKALAATAPFPPAGFTLKSKNEIELEKQAEFESRHPELALWRRIKAALLAEDGEAYFQSGVKGAAVPQLAGVLAAASPACRPVELTVAVEPGQPEVRLRLAKPLAGRPEWNGEIRFQGVPAAYTRDPFSVTMDVEPAKIEGLKIAPCPPRR